MCRQIGIAPNSRLILRKIGSNLEVPFLFRVCHPVPRRLSPRFVCFKPRGAFASVYGIVKCVIQASVGGGCGGVDVFSCNALVLRQRGGLCCPLSSRGPSSRPKSALQGARTYRSCACAGVCAHARASACVRARVSVLCGGYEDRRGGLTAGARCALAGRARPRAPARERPGDHKVLQKRSNADHLQVDSVHLPPYSSPIFPDILAPRSILIPLKPQRIRTKIIKINERTV